MGVLILQQYFQKLRYLVCTKDVAQQTHTAIARTTPLALLKSQSRLEKDFHLKVGLTLAREHNVENKSVMQKYKQDSLLHVKVKSLEN